MIKSFGTTLAALAIVGMSLPAYAVDAPTGRAVQDVRLTKDNLLLGAVVGSAGELKPNTVVKILHEDRVVATVRTDSKGRYAIKGLRPGVHTVQTAVQKTTCRFWNDSVAPPTARQALVLSGNQSVVRGQSGGGVGRVLLPLAFFGAVAAVTIASTTDDDNRTISTIPPASP